MEAPEPDFLMTYMLEKEMNRDDLIEHFVAVKNGLHYVLLFDVNRTEIRGARLLFWLKSGELNHAQKVHLSSISKAHAMLDCSRSFAMTWTRLLGISSHGLLATARYSRMECSECTHQCTFVMKESDTVRASIYGS